MLKFLLDSLFSLHELKKQELASYLNEAAYQSISILLHIIVWTHFL